MAENACLGGSKSHSCWPTSMGSCVPSKWTQTWCCLDRGRAMASATTRQPAPHSQRCFATVVDESGMALVLTLLIVTLVAVVVLELNYLMRVEVHASANFRDGV